jgi:hypothetical protein
MNLQLAFDLLEISLDNIPITEVTQTYIKNKYHKMALKWHPDKNGNTILSTNKFQKIHEAYEYLLFELSNTKNDNIDIDVNGSYDSTLYMSILTTFISSIITGNYNELFINIIREIVIVGYNETRILKMFAELDKQTAIDIYKLLFNYKDILYINNHILEFVSLIIKDKYKNDRIFILNPSVKDLIDNNIYKLYIDDNLYLVPLWHDELYFDAPDGSEIIVLCQPVLPNEMTIDENNNIYITLHVDLQTELYNMLNDDCINCVIGDKLFCVPLHKLYIKKEQLYIFKKQGISQILESDVYNIAFKSDIIIKISIN